jgi:NADPH2:quinone reductase
MTRPSYMQAQWRALLPMIESGVVAPPVGATYELADFGRALQDMEARRTLGKAVVRVR